MRELPQDAKVLLKILSTPGHWAPVISEGNRLAYNATYRSLEPQPHSLSALAACGALDDSPAGIGMLYIIMATKYDEARPRYQQAFHFSDGFASVIAPPTLQNMALISQDRRDAYERLTKIQRIVREYGEELVAEGVLRP